MPSCEENRADGDQKQHLVNLERDTWYPHSKALMAGVASRPLVPRPAILPRPPVRATMVHRLRLGQWRALEARDIYVVQILKTEGLRWLRRVGLDGKPGVTSGAPILLLKTGVPVADRGIGSHCGSCSHSGRFGPPGGGFEFPDRSRLQLNLLVISRPLARRKTSVVGDGGESYRQDRHRDHPPSRRHPGQSHRSALRGGWLASLNTNRGFTLGPRRKSSFYSLEIVDGTGIFTLYKSYICRIGLLPARFGRVLRIGQAESRRPTPQGSANPMTRTDRSRRGRRFPSRTDTTSSRSCRIAGPEPMARPLTPGSPRGVGSPIFSASSSVFP